MISSQLSLHQPLSPPAKPAREHFGKPVIVPPGYAMLETMGRKTGNPRRTPVGDGRVGSQFWIVAEHGMNAGDVRNIGSNPRVRPKVREGLRTRWYTGNAHLPPEDDPRERQRWLARERPGSAANASVV